MNFVGTSPSEFQSTATLRLWLETDNTIDGAWSDCNIEGGQYVSCHFWHQAYDSGWVFKPNLFELSADGSTFKIKDHPYVESEAQKCQGDLAKQP